MKKQYFYLLVVSFLGFSFSTIQAQVLNEALGSQAGGAITSGDYNTMLGDSAAYKLSSGHRSVMVGMAAGRNATTGQQNTYVGHKAGYSNSTGQDNTAVGEGAGYFSTDTDGVFIGTMAGYNNTIGSDVVFVGEEAGLKNTTGDDLTFMGEDAGYNNTTASDNTFVGSTAGRTNTTGFRNAFFGSEAGYDNRDGHHNVAVGDSAMIDNSTGRWNTMVGAGSGAGSEYATCSTFIGAYAGYDNNRTNYTTTARRAWYNTYVGMAAGSSNREGSYNTALGYAADMDTSTSYYPYTNGNHDSTAGNGSQKNYDRGVYLGAFANSGGDDIVALGYDAETFGNKAIAIGAYSDADSQDAIALGYLTDVTGTGSIGIGREANTTHNDAIAIGKNASTTYTNAIAMGRTSVADSSSIAIGYQANALGKFGLAIGESASVGEAIEYSMAIGYGSSATTSNSMVLGGVTTTDRVSVGIGTTAPNQNASLDLADVDKGLLVNRLTTAQKTTLQGNLTATDYGMLVYDTDLKGLYVWDGAQWLSALADNLGSHLATTTLNMGTNAIENATYLDIKNTEGYGVRFWNGSDNFKISMGNSSEYQFGVVSDYSIKNSMNATAGRGWTWGVNGQTPIAALDNTGKMQIANTMTIGAYTLPNTDGTTDQVLSTDGSGAVTWVDATVNTDAQDLELSLNTLSLTNDGTTVDLSGYLDNTDNQDLTISNHVLSLSNDVTGVDLSAYINTDTQLTEAQVDTYVSNNGYLTTFTEVDGDATNEIQDINLSGTNLSISSGSTVDLSALQDGTGSDNQDLTSATLTGSTLAIDIESGDAVNVDLAPLLTDLEDRVTALEAVSTPSGTDMTPQQFNYQAVVRDTAGDVLANTLVNFQISILQTTSTGTSVYVETHSATTSATGLTNFEIGSGTLVSGDFTTIDWAGDTHYLQIDADITGGTSYTLLGTSQLVSVPYALHAKTADYLSGISTAKLKYELDVKTEKIKSLEDKVLKLEKMMLKILDKK